MVVQCGMEEVRVCPVAPPPPLGAAPQDDGDDPEVMQVTGEGLAVHLRPKKQRVNGASQPGVTWGDTEERERPMSWEGELSDEDDDDDGEAQVAQPTPGGVRPGNSPMLVERDEGATSPISLTVSAAPDSKGNGTNDKCISRVNLPDKSNHVITYVAPVSPAPSTPYGSVTPTVVPAFPERQQHTHNSSFGEGRLGGGAFQPPPFGESPRPTSSSSSRSSYSPSQSPLLGSSRPLGLPPRHGAASSDGSLYSPTSSPLQGRHVSLVEAVYSPSQSPSQGRHRLADGLSPTAAHLRNLSVSRTGTSAGPFSSASTEPPYPYLVVQPTPDTRSTGCGGRHRCRRSGP